MKTFLKIVAVLVVISGLTWLGWQQAQKFKKFTPETVTVRQQPEKPAVVVAIGDIACPPGKPKTDTQCRQADVFAAIKKIDPDNLILLGDIQYEKGELANFQAVFGPLLGNLKDRSWPTPGNHEYATPGASGYNSFWSDHPSYGVIKNGYYDNLINNWKIISLNSNCQPKNNCDLEKQNAWLNTVLLTRKPAACTVAFWHHPLYSSGPHHGEADMLATKVFWDSLQKVGTDIILNGHDHLYERFARQNADGTKNDKGIRQFTVGTGGKSLYKATIKEPNQEFITDKTYGFLKLDLYNHYYRWAFIDVNGTVLDKGHETCLN